MTSSGYTGDRENDTTAYIVDSDGDIVWAAPAPPDASRAKLDYEGENMWMLGLNFGGTVNHGHLLSDGSFLIFNNSPRDGGDNSNVLEFDLAQTEGSMTASLVKDYQATTVSGVLGDVQRLPGGNTLITYSDASQITEVDADWQIVQTFSGSVGYADWRPTLYGPPARL